MMQIAAYDMLRANAPYRVALAAVTEAVLDSGQLIMGHHLDQFEEAFAHYCGTSHCIGTANGLDALALALEALGIGEGDEVIVPAFTFIATWFSVVQVGARPLPVDVRQDGLIDPDLIAAAITPRTRAVVPVHLFGTLADMESILAIARRFGVHVIEDAAQAHGAERGGKRAGSFGVASAFSFYPTKNLGALGDGGAVSTDDSALAARVRRLREGTLDRGDLDLPVKLTHLDAANGKRRHVAQRYSSALSSASIEGLSLPQGCPSSVWHQYVIRTRDRSRLQQALAQGGVGTTIHYPVMPFQQSCFAGQYDGSQFPVATQLAETVLSLPMGDYLSDDEVDHTIRVIVAAGKSVPSDIAA